MPRFEDYGTDPEVKDIMERYLKKFSAVFPGYDLDEIGFIVTKKKKPTQTSKPITLKKVPYPHYVFSGKTYIVEVLESLWSKMTQKQKNLAVFHTMCAIPIGGFDPASKVYGNKVRPEIVMYRMEYAASGGVPDWMENDAAKDPMEIKEEEIVIDENQELEDEDPIPVAPSVKKPVTMKDIADIGEAVGQ